MEITETVNEALRREFRITVGAQDRTLSSEEIAAIRTRIVDALRAAGYELKI